MEFKRTIAFFKAVLLDDCGIDPSESLEPNNLVNLYAASPVMGISTSHAQIGTALLPLP